jgi:creatinine amidohydrolase
VKKISQRFVKNKFKNIIIINDHLGGQTTVIKEIAADITNEVLNENGSHAGWNENAFIQVIGASLIQQDRYNDDLAIAYSQRRAIYQILPKKSQRIF